MILVPFSSATAAAVPELSWAGRVLMVMPQQEIGRHADGDRAKRKQQRRYSKTAARRLNRRDRGRWRRCRLHDWRRYVRDGQHASRCRLGRGRRDGSRAA